MLHVVTQENRHLYTRGLEEMFRLRYEVFVEERGWKLPCEGPLEIDQFDVDEAIYFLYFVDEDSEDSEVAATFRMLPTTGPHLMSEVFPHLCYEQVLVGEGVYEGTRAAVRRKHRRAGIVWQSMMAGIYEYCLLCGIDRLTGIFDMPVFLDRIRHGVDFRPLGPPTEVDGEMCIALYRPISIESVQVIRQQLGLKGPMLTYIRDLERAA